MNVARIRRLAGLREATQVPDPDEEDRLYDEQRNREQKINRLIALAFRRIDLTIAEDGIFYQEDADREAHVTLDDSQVDVARLAALQQTGLANSYVIWGTKDGLSVMFTVLDQLDNAVISPTKAT